MEHEETDWPPGASVELFAENLRALGGDHPALAERLCWAVAGDHLREQPDGEITYERRGASLPLAVRPEDVELSVQAALASAGEGARVLVCGVGLGELVSRLLAEEGTRVVAWDRDPWLLRTLLSRHELADPLRTGRLNLAMGADLAALAEDPTIGARIEHPLLAGVYARELEAFRLGFPEPRALLCEGGLYVDSLGRALRDEGWSVWTVDVERLSEEELDHTVATLRPRFVAGINYREGLVEFSRRHGLELLVWEIDPFTHRPSPPRVPTDHAAIYSYRRQNVADLAAIGFERARYLPLAADTHLRRPLALTDVERGRYAAPVTFVGSSLAGNAAAHARTFAEVFRHWAAEARRDDRPAAVADAVLAEQRRSPDTWLVPEALEDRVPGFAAWCRRNAPQCDPALLLGEVAASERRLRTVAELAGLGIEVWGDSGWSALEERGVRYRGPATHEHDLTRIYAASAINLDLGRLYQNDIVTMRVFDVLACGGFALVEHSEALEELFEVGVELESHRDLEECRDKVRYYLQNPDRARAIAERGFEAVRERHTFAGRVRSILGSLEAGADALELAG